MAIRGTIHIARPPQACSRALRFADRRPLGFATLEPETPTELCPDYAGRLLSGYLRHIGAVQVSHRVPVLVSPEDQDAIQEGLRDASTRSLNADPAWVVVPGTTESDAGADGLLFFMTRRQATWIPIQGEHVAVRTPNHQVLNAIWHGRGRGTALPPVYGEQPLQIEGLLLGSELFQLTPTWGRRHATESPNPYYCILNPRHRQSFGSRYCVIRNPYLENAYPGFSVRVPALPVYDDEIEPTQVALDATLYVSVGLRTGEVAAVEPVDAEPSRWGRRLFTYRHAVCRVTRAGAADMEKPLVRLPAEVLDSLGIESGGRVVIEGAVATPEGNEIRRLGLRALQSRTETPAYTYDGPDFFDEAGGLDIPLITLDRVRRESLGLNPGSPVYVRPALGTALADELTSVSLLLLAGTVGALAADELALSLALIAAYVTFVAWRTLRRFR